MEKTISFVPPLPSGNGAEEQLGFAANSVIVNNPTPTYYFLPDVNIYIPPMAQQMIVPLIGTQVARIRYAAPVGVTNPTQTPNGNPAISFRFTDMILPPDSGTILGGSGVGRGAFWIPFTAQAGITRLQPLQQAAPDGVAFIPQWAGVAPLVLTNLSIGYTMPDIVIGGAVCSNRIDCASIRWIPASGTAPRLPGVRLAGFIPAGASFQILCSQAFSGYITG